MSFVLHHGHLRTVQEAQHQPSSFGASGLPNLLRNLELTRSNHVVAADNPQISMKHGFVYLISVLDWARRRVLSWRLSNTLTTDFCTEAVQETIHCYDKQEIGVLQRAQTTHHA